MPWRMVECTVVVLLPTNATLPLNNSGILLLFRPQFTVIAINRRIPMRMACVSSHTHELISCRIRNIWVLRFIFVAYSTSICSNIDKERSTVCWIYLSSFFHSFVFFALFLWGNRAKKSKSRCIVKTVYSPFSSHNVVNRHHRWPVDI